MSADPGTTPLRGTRIDVRIDGVYGELPPQERRVADFLLEHLGDLAIFSAADISREVGVSKATVSRLFRRLGFGHFTEVREHARTLRSHGVLTAAPVYSGARWTENGEVSSGLQRHVSHEQANLAALGSILSGERFEQAVELLAGARQVVLVGLRNSYSVALHFHQQLIQVRDHVRLAPQPGQTLGEEVAGLGEGDLVLIVGFRRRPRVIGRLVERVGASPASLVLVADSTARHHARHADLWLECPLDSEGAFDSYAAAMSLVSVLSNGVLNERLSTGRARISTIAAHYEDLGEIES